MPFLRRCCLLVLLFKDFKVNKKVLGKITIIMEACIVVLQQNKRHLKRFIKLCQKKLQRTNWIKLLRVDVWLIGHIRSLLLFLRTWCSRFMIKWRVWVQGIINKKWNLNTWFHHSTMRNKYTKQRKQNLRILKKLLVN